MFEFNVVDAVLLHHVLPCFFVLVYVQVHPGDFASTLRI